MARRVDGKAAIVVGGGQTPGETIGNGRATAIVLAREGARVLVADRHLDSAQATVDLIRGVGHQAWAFEADITDEEAVRRLVAAARERFGRLDILHNNVGASLALGDAPATELTEAAFDRSIAVNLKGMWLACKHALPALRESAGSIVNISSMAARNAYPLVGYKTTKAAVVALTENLAAANASYGVRANSILPGLMNTPMAIEARVARGTSREEVIASRDRRVPLRRRMGTGWDVAYAALFLHSDEAGFVTGVSLAVVVGAFAMARTGVLWIDPALSLVIAGVIVLGAWGLLRDSVDLALDAAPRGIDVDEVRRWLKGLPGVEDVHDLHVWALSTTETAMTAHILRPQNGDGDRFLHMACEGLETRFRIGHATLQVETDAAHTCRLAPAEVV